MKMKRRGIPEKTVFSKQEENLGKSRRQKSDEFQNGEAQKPLKLELIQEGLAEMLEAGLEEKLDPESMGGSWPRFANDSIASSQ